MTKPNYGLRCANRAILISAFVGLVSGQSTQPLTLIQSIPIPNWTNTGATQANLDLFAFNPWTRVMYVADRTNHGVTAIDTITNTPIGTFPLPGGGSTNGVLVALDLQKLVVTDGKANVIVYDLRVPGAPDIYALPGVTGGTDALDYDPLNHTVYVINGSAPYFMSGIDLVNGRVSSQLALPGSPELMRFNPNDGLIYQAITDSDKKGAGQGLYVFDPVTNAITAKYLTPGCTPHGVEIDPVSNVALLGCSPGGQVLLDLGHGGSVLSTFPNITGTDLTAYNPNTRNFYTGSGSNNLVSNGCPIDSGKNYPLIGIFNVNASGQGNLVGVQCTGRSAKGPGVDPFDNFVYVGTRQFPVDANDGTTGQNGVLVYYDPSPRIDAMPGTGASLTSFDKKQNYGAVRFTTEQHRGLRVTVRLQNAPAGVGALSVSTSIGNEPAPCYVASDGTGSCDGPLLGSPVIGAPVLFGIGGAPAGRGSIQ
ncbi:MAG: hypothetical protein M3Z09_12495 [Acidobacteriota bacterium]|nr:hypothetical protein [Acidobacteriota bacterium]